MSDRIHAAIEASKARESRLRMELQSYETTSQEARFREALAVAVEALDKLLNKVNAVTAPHRHGNEVRPYRLDELCARQIEVEEMLAGIERIVTGEEK